MPFFVVSNNEDGTSITQGTREELLKAIQPDENGEADIAASDILASIPGPDMDCWRGTLIIKGEIIVPKAIEVVTRFEL